MIPTLETAPTSDEVYRAASKLRFAQGLRRGWPEARAESAVREAASIGWLEGMRIPVADLRELVVTRNLTEGDYGEDPLPPDLAYVLGVWRATWSVLNRLPALNSKTPMRTAPSPIPLVLAGINRDVCSFLVASGHTSAREVAIPKNPEVLGAVTRLARATGTQTLARAAEIWRLISAERLFEVGSEATAILFVKWLLADSGVEPTGVSVLSYFAGAQPATYRTLASAGSEEDVSTAWSNFLKVSVLQGCEEGERVALAVQAGRLPQN